MYKKEIISMIMFSPDVLLHRASPSSCSWHLLCRPRHVGGFAVIKVQTYQLNLAWLSQSLSAVNLSTKKKKKKLQNLKTSEPKFQTPKYSLINWSCKKHVRFCFYTKEMLSKINYLIYCGISIRYVRKQCFVA